MNIAHRATLQAHRVRRGPCVPADSARWMLRISARAATAAGVGASSMRMDRIAFSRPSVCASSSLIGRSWPSKRRLHNTTSMPNAAARLITSCAMLPTPRMPSRLAAQAARLRELLLVPLAGAELGDVVGDAAIEREDQRERQLGNGDRVLARTVGHVDAALGGRGHVDRVVAGAGANDERQPAGIEHRRRDAGAAHDEHFCARSNESPPSGHRP